MRRWHIVAEMCLALVCFVLGWVYSLPFVLILICSLLSVSLQISLKCLSVSLLDIEVSQEVSGHMVKTILIKITIWNMGELDGSRQYSLYISFILFGSFLFFLRLVFILCVYLRNIGEASVEQYHFVLLWFWLLSCSLFALFSWRGVRT